MSTTRKQYKPDEEDDGKRAPEDAVASIVLTLGRKGPVTSDAELLERLKEGAKTHPGCAWMLGELFLEGLKGVEQDVAEAIKYLRMAAEKGFEPAIEKLYSIGVPFTRRQINDYIDDVNHVPTSPRFLKAPYADSFNSS